MKANLAVANKKGGEGIEPAQRDSNNSLSLLPLYSLLLLPLHTINSEPYPDTFLFLPHAFTQALGPMLAL